MPRLNRSEVCTAAEVQVFHLINRCVRRTYLCGQDRRSGKDYSHRKEWIRQRLEELAGIFGIDVLGFAVMSNHLHVVGRTRPDLVAAWSDDEITLRWWRLFPQRRNEDHSPAEPTEPELAVIRNDVAGLLEKRKRLADISRLMRCLVEPIARRSNKEDEVTGRFWEGRFKAQPLLDETAIAACLAYVDLNPIRAKVASSLEESDFTSLQARIVDRQSAAEVTTPDAKDARTEHGEQAGWLAPIALDPPRQKVREKSTGRRASNKGCLPMTLDTYLALLDRSAASSNQVRPDPRSLRSNPGAPGMQRRDLAGLRPELPPALPKRSQPGQFPASLPQPAKASADNISSDIRTAGHQQLAKRGKIMASAKTVDGTLVPALTTPEYDENVSWVVLKESLRLPKKEIVEMIKIFQHPARLPQPLNRRFVLANFHS